MRGTGKHKPPQWMQPCPQDNTSDFIVKQVEHWVDRPYFTEIIHTEVAREIASWWASSSPRGMNFTAFATAGNILDEDNFLAAIRLEVISQLELTHHATLDTENLIEILSSIKALMALDHYVRCVS